jgi:hypothetical protein
MSSFHSKRGSFVKERERRSWRMTEGKRTKKKKYPSGVKFAMTNAKIGSGIICLKSTCPVKTPAPTVKKESKTLLPSGFPSFFSSFSLLTFL